LILLGITYVTDVSFIVQFLVGLIGLGVAIDYSLLIVSRWREERAHGLSNDEAVVVAMQTAGRAVVLSGLAVAVGLVALVALPVPFLRSVGFGGMLIPLVSVAVATTMLPAILGGIGPRIDWPRIRHEGAASRFWTSWGQGIVRRRWIAAGSALVVLGVLFVQFLNISIGTAKSDSLSKSGPAYTAWHTLDQSGVPHGVLTPIVIDAQSQDASAIATRVRTVNGVVTAFAPGGNAATAAGTTLVLAIPNQENYNGSTVQAVRDVRTVLTGQPGVVGVTGVGAGEIDFLDGVYSNFPLVLALIVVVTFILLVRTFRSLVLPLKAIVLNLASVSATFGALVLFWQDGYGSQAVFGIAPTGSITFWLPIMIFAFLFGLSMDYEVFILARMREEYDVTGSTNQAVVTGLGRTGRLVTSAALILFLAFLSLASGPETDIKVFATGLGFGILLDATVVRMLLVPALVSLFGDWNWYLPDGVARVLRITPSHAAAHAAARAQRGEAA
ncbi:MAG TPA: MMPL family transporter, partial [Candidatus Dormibacteraeota bacterium]|nr:MMPL family transporter [Candidatus Dormibacteraeota bacterium]